MKTYVHLWSYLVQVFLKWETLQTNVVEKSKHISCSITLLLKYLRLWDNVETYCTADSQQITIRRMRIACCLPKATNTQSGYVIHIVSPLQQWLNERVSMLRYDLLTFKVNIITSDTATCSDQSATVRPYNYHSNVKRVTTALPCIVPLWSESHVPSYLKLK